MVLGLSVGSEMADIVGFLCSSDKYARSSLPYAADVLQKC